MTTYDCQYHGRACEYPGQCINQERLKKPKCGWIHVASRNVLNAYDHRSQYRNRKPHPIA